LRLDTSMSEKVRGQRLTEMEGKIEEERKRYIERGGVKRRRKTIYIETREIQNEKRGIQKVKREREKEKDR
jgi:hypothetical protein